MIQAYLDGKREARYHGLIVLVMIAGFALVGAIIAYMTSLGWMPLGERADILRSDISALEIVVAVAGAVYALACLRTAFGLRNRERSSLRWSQWMYFITVMIGGAILLSVIHFRSD